MPVFLTTMLLFCLALFLKHKSLYLNVTFQVDYQQADYNEYCIMYPIVSKQSGIQMGETFFHSNVNSYSKYI